MDIPAKEFIHNHKRGIHFHHLYKNYIDFLNGNIDEQHLVAETFNWQEAWFKKMRARKENQFEKGEITTENLDFNNKNEEVMLAWLDVKGAL